MNRLTILLIAMMLGVSCQQAGDVRELKMAHGLNPQHPVHIGLVYMAEKLEEVSGGKMHMSIYASEQLGTENQCVEMLQIGSLALTKVSAAALSNFVEEYKLFGLPYIFENRDQYYEFVDGELGEEMLLTTEPYLFRGLGYFDAGSRSFYTTKRPILTPEDLKGLRIRVMPSAIAVDMISAFGGSATPISMGELYTALQSGVVDGAENNPPTYFTSNDFEVAKHYTINEHTTIPDVIVMSNVVWNSLSEQEKEWLMTAVESAEVYQRDVWTRMEKESLEIVKSRGAKIYYPDKQPFIDMVADLPEKYRSNTALYEYIQKTRAFKEEYRKTHNK